jgi:hypothetical protein
MPDAGTRAGAKGKARTASLFNYSVHSLKLLLAACGVGPGWRPQRLRGLSSLLTQKFAKARRQRDLELVVSPPYPRSDHIGIPRRCLVHCSYPLLTFEVRSQLNGGRRKVPEGKSGCLLRFAEGRPDPTVGPETSAVRRGVAALTGDLARSLSAHSLRRLTTLSRRRHPHRFICHRAAEIRDLAGFCLMGTST